MRIVSNANTLHSLDCGNHRIRHVYPWFVTPAEQEKKWPDGDCSKRFQQMRLFVRADSSRTEYESAPEDSDDVGEGGDGDVNGRSGTTSPIGTNCNQIWPCQLSQQLATMAQLIQVSRTNDVRRVTHLHSPFTSCYHRLSRCSYEYENNRNGGKIPTRLMSSKKKLSLANVCRGVQISSFLAEWIVPVLMALAPWLLSVNSSRD